MTATNADISGEALNTVLGLHIFHENLIHLTILNGSSCIPPKRNFCHEWEIRWDSMLSNCTTPLSEILAHIWTATLVFFTSVNIWLDIYWRSFYANTNYFWWHSFMQYCATNIVNICNSTTIFEPKKKIVGWINSIFETRLNIHHTVGTFACLLNFFSRWSWFQQILSIFFLYSVDRLTFGNIPLTSYIHKSNI